MASCTRSCSASSSRPARTWPARARIRRCTRRCARRCAAGRERPDQEVGRVWRNATARAATLPDR
eukprot:6075122-Prymnesium_polylepis.1